MVSLASGGEGQANDVSADGSVVVGEYGVPATLEECSPGPCEIANPGTVRAFRWTQGGGLVPQQLDQSDPEVMGAGAIGVSADGSVLLIRQFLFLHNCIFGQPNSACVSLGVGRTELQTVLSTPAGTQVVDLERVSLALALSADGNLVLGWTPGGLFRWSASTGVELLAASSVPSALSADGTVIGGGFELSLGDEQADITNLLINGVGLRVHGLSFGSVGGISADGRVLAGSAATAALNPDRVGYLFPLDTTPSATDAVQLPAVIRDSLGSFNGSLLPAQCGIATGAFNSGGGSIHSVRHHDQSKSGADVWL